jgi:hypothetical protein
VKNHRACLVCGKYNDVLIEGFGSSLGQHGS